MTVLFYSSLTVIILHNTLNSRHRAEKFGLAFTVLLSNGSSPCCHLAPFELNVTKIFLHRTLLCVVFPRFCSQYSTFYPLYTTPLSSLISSLNLNHHLCADYIQLFYSFYLSDYDSTTTHLQNAREHISSWLTANLLTLNSSETEFLIGNRQQTY